MLLLVLFGLFVILTIVGIFKGGILYIRKQYKTAIATKDKEINCVLDAFRDEIVKQLESIVKSDNYGAQYKLLIRNKGYYESIQRDLYTKKNREEVFKSYNLCFQEGCWYLLDKIDIQDAKLVFWVDAYCSLAPDYGCLTLDNIPTNVLYEALKIFNEVTVHEPLENKINDKEDAVLRLTDYERYVLLRQLLQTDEKEVLNFRLYTLTGLGFLQEKDRNSPIVLNMFHGQWDIQRLYDALIEHILKYHCFCTFESDNFCIRFSGYNYNIVEDIVADRIVSVIMAYNCNAIKIYRMYNIRAEINLAISGVEMYSKINLRHLSPYELKEILGNCDMFRYKDSRIFTEDELITDYNYPTISDVELEIARSFSNK